MLRNLSIQSKLVLMLLLVSLLSLLAASAIGYKSGRDSMTESAYQHLVTVRAQQAQAHRPGPSPAQMEARADTR